MLPRYPQSYRHVSMRKAKEQEGRAKIAGYLIAFAV